MSDETRINISISSYLSKLYCIIYLWRETEKRKLKLITLGRERVNKFSINVALGLPQNYVSLCFTIKGWRSVRVLEFPSWKKKNQTCPVKTKAIYGSDGDKWQPTHKDAHRIRNAGIFLLCKEIS